MTLRSPDFNTGDSYLNDLNVMRDAINENGQTTRSLGVYHGKTVRRLAQAEATLERVCHQSKLIAFGLLLVALGQGGIILGWILQ